MSEVADSPASAASAGRRRKGWKGLNDAARGASACTSARTSARTSIHTRTRTSIARVGVVNIAAATLVGAAAQIPLERLSKELRASRTRVGPVAAPTHASACACAAREVKVRHAFVARSGSSRAWSIGRLEERFDEHAFASVPQGHHTIYIE